MIHRCSTELMKIGLKKTEDPVALTGHVNNGKTNLHFRRFFGVSFILLVNQNGKQHHK